MSGRSQLGPVENCQVFGRRTRRREQSRSFRGAYLPQCGWSLRKEQRWACDCGNECKTFDTRGVCPACLHQWTSMQCLSCASWSTAQTEARAFLKATSVSQLGGRSERLGRPFFLQHAFSRCVTTVSLGVFGKELFVIGILRRSLSCLFRHSADGATFWASWPASSQRRWPKGVRSPKAFELPFCLSSARSIFSLGKGVAKLGC